MLSHSLDSMTSEVFSTLNDSMAHLLAGEAGKWAQGVPSHLPILLSILTLCQGVEAAGDSHTALSSCAGATHSSNPWWFPGLGQELLWLCFSIYFRSSLKRPRELWAEPFPPLPHFRGCLYSQRPSFFIFCCSVFLLYLCWMFSIRFISSTSFSSIV